ncbi:MAG: sigma 54-interacting transcriptional regulator [Bacteroidia bacterium]|nr:sigma 54-interacting transcriptional regulator [Bacteroidia bacterium]
MKEKKKNIQEKRKQTLISIVSPRDPFIETVVEEMAKNGPILGLLAQKNFDNLVLLVQPNLKERALMTREYINSRYPLINIRLMQLNISDVINYLEILHVIRDIIRYIQEDYKNDEYYINVSCGTPQMHTCWVLLAASGEIPAHILNIRETRHITKDKGYVLELDFSAPEFPVIKSNILQAEILQTAQPNIKEAIKRFDFVADHPLMQEVLEKITTIASYNISVLIQGETGTGKEVTARLIHLLSPRSNSNFVAVNCAAIPKELIESTLFGHKKGAFTGAVSDFDGKFVQADNGTLFLDELGELPSEAQKKLLRVLQSGEVEPIGSSHSVQVNVRVIAATNADIAKMIADNTFREDLYHRIAKTVIDLPPLRERITDIPKIAVRILDRINLQLLQTKKFDPKALLKLQAHPWTGNIRELENTVENAVIFTKGYKITEKDIQLPKPIHKEKIYNIPVPYYGFSLPDYIADTRKKLIHQALSLANGNKSEAARLLGITPQAVDKFLKEK